LSVSVVALEAGTEERRPSVSVGVLEADTEER